MTLKVQVALPDSQTYYLAKVEVLALQPDGTFIVQDTHIANPQTVRDFYLTDTCFLRITELNTPKVEELPVNRESDSEPLVINEAAHGHE